MEEILQRNLEAMAPELDRQGITLESDLTPGPRKNRWTRTCSTGLS